MEKASHWERLLRPWQLPVDHLQTQVTYFAINLFFPKPVAVKILTHLLGAQGSNSLRTILRYPHSFSQLRYQLRS